MLSSFILRLFRFHSRNPQISIGQTVTRRWPCFLLCPKLFFPTIALSVPALSSPHQQGKLSGIWYTTCSLLNAHPQVRSKERRVFTLQWCPKVINVCLWDHAPSRVLSPPCLIILSPVLNTCVPGPSLAQYQLSSEALSLFLFSSAQCPVKPV